MLLKKTQNLTKNDPAGRKDRLAVFLAPQKGPSVKKTGLFYGLGPKLLFPTPKKGVPLPAMGIYRLPEGSTPTGLLVHNCE